MTGLILDAATLLIASFGVKCSDASSKKGQMQLHASGPSLCKSEYGRRMASIPFTVSLIYYQIQETSQPPSVRWLANAMGCSVSTAHTIVHGLIDRGYVEHAGHEKTITLTEKSLQLIDSIVDH
jgi:DNA-binding MarR family transcriptional regulator